MRRHTITTTRTTLPALAFLLGLAGCTGDPVEGPPTGGSGTPDGGSDARPAGPDGVGFGPGSNAPQTTPDAPDGDTAPTASATPTEVSGPAAAPTTGAIDCAGALPCRLRAAGGGFEIVLSAVDGKGADFAIEALSRDLTLGIDLASSLTADGEVAVGIEARFGAGVAGRAMGADGGPDGAARGDAPDRTAARVASHPLRPGLPINGRVAFADTRRTSPPSIDRLELVVHEAGTRTGLAFGNVPWGPAPTVDVDCALALPCEWRAPDGVAVLSVDAVGIDRWHNARRTIVDWHVTATRELALELADAAHASTDGGDALEYYGIELGGATSRGEGPLDDVAAPGAPVSGRTAFRRAPPEGATALGRLELDLVERRAPRVPRWRMVLTNLPLAR